MFRLTEEPIDTAVEAAGLADPHSGGFVEFRGCVRDHHHGRAVTRLHYAVYPAMAMAEGQRIIEEARQRYAVDHVACIHRTGDLAIGDAAVWVGVGAAHRDAAFAACRYVIDEIKRRLPIWKHEHYADGQAQWVGCEGCAGHGSALRYDRQQRVAGFGDTGQQRLETAHVAVVGLGALGCPVADLLTGAGVGRLTLIDPDRVDLSNLHRQTLYVETDAGALKVDAARRRLAERNRHVELTAVPQALDDSSAAALLLDVDLVIDCTDSAASKRLVTRLARSMGCACIVGGVAQSAGGVYASPARPEDGVCWDCICGPGGDCATSGVLGPTPAAIGATMAGEALRRLVGLSSPLTGRWTVLDFGGGQFQRFEPRQRKRCCCGADTAGLTGLPSRDWLDPSMLWIDLRSDAERQRQPLAGALALSLDQAMEGRGLSTDQRYLLVCASGRRSEAACHALREQGFRQVWTLTGGLGGCVSTAAAAVCSA